MNDLSITKIGHYNGKDTLQLKQNFRRQIAKI